MLKNIMVALFAILILTEGAFAARRTPIGIVVTPLSKVTTIRNKAGTKTFGSEIIDYVTKGTTLKVFDWSIDSDGDTWYKVKYEVNGVERHGYIFEGRVGKQTEGAETEGTCADGSCSRLSPSRRQIVEQAEAINASVQADIKGHRLGSRFNSTCSKFINSDGLGSYGRIVVDAAKRVAPNCMYKSHIFDNVCPNYRSLNKSQKDAFIALLFASIAQAESSCNPRVQVAGKNDLADGLFQMEYSARQRRAAGRDRRWCRTDKPVDTQNVTFQAECSVSIIEDTVCGWNQPINHSEGYWEKLKKNRTITKLIRDTAKRWGICR